MKRYVVIILILVSNITFAQKEEYIKVADDVYKITYFTKQGTETSELHIIADSTYVTYKTKGDPSFRMNSIKFIGRTNVRKLFESCFSKRELDILVKNRTFLSTSIKEDNSIRGINIVSRSSIIDSLSIKNIQRFFHLLPKETIWDMNSEGGKGKISQSVMIKGVLK